MAKKTNISQPKKAAPVKKASKKTGTGGGGGGKGKGGNRQSIMNATARLGRVHDGAPPRDLVAIFAGYPSGQTAGYKKMLSFLKKEGMVEFPGKDTMTLTDQGVEASGGQVAEPVSNEDFHEIIKDMLSPKHKEAFDFLADGRACERSELAELLGYPNDATPGFKKTLSQIKKQAFVEYVGRDMVQLSDKAFPFGRPSTTFGRRSTV
jgi:hypothetical protein